MLKKQILIKTLDLFLGYIFNYYLLIKFIKFMKMILHFFKLILNPYSNDQANTIIIIFIVIY